MSGKNNLPVDPTAKNTSLDKMMAYVRELGIDARLMGEAFIQDSNRRYNNMVQNPNAVTIIDYFGLGALSASEARGNAMLDDPGWYTISDWATSGTTSMVNRAVNPEKPLSLDHWMSSLGVASLAYGGYRAVQSASGSTVGNTIRVPKDANYNIANPDTANVTVNQTSGPAGNVVRTVDEILSSATSGRETKGKTAGYIKPGSYEQAVNEFDALTPSNVRDINTTYGQGKVGTLPDGRTVIARPGSSGGPPTLEIRNSSGRGIEIRYGE